jgi:hypothetical protein
MFAKARGSDMDLRALGRQLEERKLELKGESDEGGSQRMPPGGRSRGVGRDLRMRSH